MIHHVSIPAENPRHVSDVLAEVMGGRSYPFPGGFKNSFMAVSGDPRGTAIEVYPPQADVIDQADMFHIWVLRGRLPFGLHKGMYLPGLRSPVTLQATP